MAALPATEDTRFTAYRFSNGIHEITFKDTSKEAVSALFVHLHQVFEGKTHRDPRLLFLIEGTSTSLPQLSHLVSAGREMVERYPDRPQVRYALIFRGNVRFLVSVLEKIIQIFRTSNEVRSFRPEQRSEALAWLVRDIEVSDRAV